MIAETLCGHISLICCFYFPPKYSPEFRLGISCALNCDDRFISAQSPCIPFASGRYERSSIAAAPVGRRCVTCVPLERVEQLQCGVHWSRADGRVSDSGKGTRVSATVRTVRRRSIGSLEMSAGGARAGAGQTLHSRL